MNEIIAALSRLFGQVIFWATVEPWEQAIRVRAGKHVRRLAPGFHLRVPILDVIYKQSVRWRTALIATQTLSTADGATLVSGATLGYVITDVQLLYEKLHHAEDTIAQMTAAAIAAEVFKTQRAALSAAAVSARVSDELKIAFLQFGIGEVQVRVTDFALVRALRLVQDQRWAHGRGLHTESRE